MENYTIYKFTFPDGKTYIGKTKQIPVEKRWGKNGEKYKSQPVYEAISKYGWENIKKEIIINGLNKEEAEKEEAKLIESAIQDNNSYNSIHGITRYNYKEEWMRKTPEEVEANEKLRQALKKVLKGYQLTIDLLNMYNNHPNNISKWIHGISEYGISLKDEKELYKKIIKIKKYWESIDV